MSNSLKPLGIGIELIDDPAWMGGVLYLQNLALSLISLPSEERPHLRLLGSGTVIERFLKETGKTAILTAERPSLLAKIRSRLGWSTGHKSKVDVIYPGFGGSVEGAEIIRWIPDFQHRYLPSLFSIEEKEARENSIGAIASQRGAVVLSSEVAAADFRRFFPDCKATAFVWRFCSSIQVTRPASRFILEKFGLPGKYLYLPNQFWVHKNHITVLKAIAQLKSEQGLVIPLVCTGAQSDRRDTSHFSELHDFISANDLSGQVFLLGLIDRSDQVEIFRHAAAVVQPSLFEGWSTVVEDTRALGRPIFLSDIAVHREQAPNYCFYFDANSPRDLAKLIIEQWAELEPGPDQFREELAGQQRQKRMLDAAREFCAIARAAIDIGGSNDASPG